MNEEGLGMEETGFSQPDAAPADVAPGPVAADPRDAELAELRAKVAHLEAEAPRAAPGVVGAETVRVKVEAPHASMTHAGATIGSEFTEVPSFLMPAIQQAAYDAGVTITQEG